MNQSQAASQLNESSYIPRFLSRVVKDKALVVYQVLFSLSWFETGRGEIVVPWARVGAFIRSEQGNIIDNNTTVKRRLPDLFEKKCISVARQRGSANEITVNLPPQIPSCRALIEQETTATLVEEVDLLDYYSEPSRRRVVLERDARRCQYCRIEIDEDTYVLDHLVPIARGGTNRKSNLVSACETCNRRKGEQEPVGFLLSNYRMSLISQDEFLAQRETIERLLASEG